MIKIHTQFHGCGHGDRRGRRGCVHDRGHGHHDHGYDRDGDHDRGRGRENDRDDHNHHHRVEDYYLQKSEVASRKLYYFFLSLMLTFRFRLLKMMIFREFSFQFFGGFDEFVSRLNYFAYKNSKILTFPRTKKIKLARKVV